MNFKFLLLLMLPLLGFAQTNEKGDMQNGGTTTSEKQPFEMKRNASFNLDEIKVRWKKAALENCPGVPCASFSVPGPVTSIAATPTGPTSVSVAFVAPSSDGGSTITGYVATATSTSSAPAKRKSSATITVEGKSSPIDIPGLTSGVNYIFTVVAINAAGGSLPTVTVIPVTPCILNTATALRVTPPIYQNRPINIDEPISISSTTGATGIGDSKGLPTGLIASWSANKITIKGTPTTEGNFTYTIPLTGGCGSVNATGTITVTPPECTAGEPSSFPELAANTAMNEITIPTSNATGIGNAFNLPPGVTATWSNNRITISGTPREPGNYQYEIALTGPCGQAFARGAINVTQAECSAGEPSSFPELAANTAMNEITIPTFNATGIGNALNLPPGVTASWSNNRITISGTPTEPGSYLYEIALTGPCGQPVFARGAINVTQPECSAAPPSSFPGLAVNTAMNEITHRTINATGIGIAINLPPGVTATWSNNLITISGTPTQSGSYNYKIPLTGPCVEVFANGAILVTF
jgi:hypothetical protein